MITQISQIVRDHDRFVPLQAFDEDEAATSDELAPEDFLVNIGDFDEDDDMEPIDASPSAVEETLERMRQLREQYRRSEKDTGSPEFQIAGMTERIAYLTKHLKEHPKDFSTRRGLVALVNKRRRMLNYLTKTNPVRYEEMINSLGIRHKPPGRVPSRAEIYSRFPKQKAVKKHLIRKKK